ncbi:MAG: hypothetical protein WC827_02980 [Candidatus Paceibacterota bacterium]|jgi:hypothetical protein
MNPVEQNVLESIEKLPKKCLFTDPYNYRHYDERGIEHIDKDRLDQFERLLTS